MRALLWNMNGGRPSAIAWLKQQAWDVAMLLEVRRPCWRELESHAWVRGGTSDAAHQSGHELAVAVLHRPGLEILSVVPPPSFTAKAGRYEHRALAIELADERGDRWTVL